MSNESTTKPASEDGSPRCAVAPSSASDFRLYNDPKLLALLTAMRTQPDKEAIDTFVEFFARNLVTATYTQVLKSQQEITRLRDEREWLQFVVNFVRLPLGIAPDVSNFDREKILAALDAALSSPNTSFARSAENEKP